ncbi:kinase-like domain-containing protein [Rhizophagus irregularis DAOM 181602=DAOM 197198]|uniref:Kinase-like domain-containing protein n=1 Tax=Rhizophagus irregularis (strain DAOM 181602 / DAOM 197198 / MUCL 43194) TaxID=747089 RepID=A0A2P4P346_RHIID|nr:kinase-like domain-containing protein [Rhizophagus irregularis DAOM 181602=DAOM 197198]POG59813.1 kinase-like domain-containing protein [Rhizophagus irregularis DAOM 181602=DAOM 197198]|eukprot:XP_025166679.1 kinase-like domain-containing protein [Rhizophagus irregularis DAOM 181602=DAOM 197198]
MSYNWNNWIEEAILNEHINCYEYKDFYNLEGIGTGGFGKVYRANWKDSHNIYALKSLKYSEAKKFVDELKIQRKVNVHDNIIRFYGITRVDQNYSSKIYMLVMEYADGGTLREYLRKNSGNLTWNDKFKMAYQLASAVSILHNLGVIHRDLHSNNVLVHGNNVKLADFGLSKKTDESVTSRRYGVIPYIDPKKIASDSYSRNEKSDIYSVGVLLWEISSGRPPFEGKSEYFLLTNIPEDCWEFEPDDRPTIYNVVDRLEAISSKTTKSWNSSPSSRNNSSPSSRNYSSLSSRDNLSQSFKQKESKDIVDGIAALPSKIYDKRKKQKILDYLEDNHVTSKEILDWLENNQNYPNSLLVLGDFHYLGIATEVDKRMACEFYEKAGDGDDGLSVAQYNLGVIYETDKLDDTIAALYWYNKSAEQGNHEARESFYRLRGTSGTKTVSSSSIQKYGSMGIFNR